VIAQSIGGRLRGRKVNTVMHQRTIQKKREEFFPAKDLLRWSPFKKLCACEKAPKVFVGGRFVESLLSVQASPSLVLKDEGDKVLNLGKRKEIAGEFI